MQSEYEYVDDEDDDNHSDLMCLALSQMWCASIQAFFFSDASEGPAGVQAQWFKHLQDGYTLHVPDFQQLTPAQKIEKAIAVTHDLEEIVIVASGTGASIACALYQQYPQRFDHLLLLSPVLDSQSLEQIKEMPPQQLKIVYGLENRLHQRFTVIEKALSDLANHIIGHR